MIRKAAVAAVLLGSTALLSPAVHAQPAAPPAVAAATEIPLEQQFRDPPQSARPRVWWHWMNGNVTKDGIAKDLAWMKRVGIGGLQNFDANLATPQVVDHRLAYMTPEWRDAFRFAASEADRLGLELGIAASPGWSETGGPWVPPADGMKKLVWSERVLPGGKRFRGVLPALPGGLGPYQTVPFTDDTPGAGGEGHARPTAGGPVAVLAVPVAAPPLPAPAYALGDGTTLAAAPLTDADLASAATVPLAADLSATVTASYPAPVTLRSVRVFVPGIKLPFRGVPLKLAFEAREGTGWRLVSEIPVTGVPTTRSFAAVTAQQFRLRVADAGDTGNLDLIGAAPGAVAINFFDTGPLKAIRLADFQLFAEARVDRAEEKAGYETVLDYAAIAGAQDGAAGQGAAGEGAAIDLTDRVRPDGSLDWTPPKGADWRVLRFGWALTGTTNHPATPEATGLEVDKFDAAAVRRYLETYLAQYRATVGPDLFGQRGVKALVTDSIEVGLANWTGAMEAEFAARRHYALRPWLPALAGVVVGSPAQTDRFLFDYRQTLAELIFDRHYATVAAVAHEQGLTVYGEALENQRPVLGDDLAMRSHADVPMAAMWTFAQDRQIRSSLLGDLRGAASVAHVLGRPFVAAESMTSVNAPWDFAPSGLRKVIDLEFASGINRPVIHTSVHQPADDKAPGLTLAIFGQYFNRLESWSGLARGWVDYIARSSLLLQQGSNVADVAWFTGEDSPVTALYADGVPANLPRAHGWDFVNAAMLGGAMANDGADLVTPGGARYRAIYLGGTSARMTLPTLERLAALVRGGASVIGVKPLASPSQADDPSRFAALADALWSGETGKGRVIATAALDEGLARIGIAPDFRMAGAAPGEVLFVHRHLPDGDLWFVNNRRSGGMTGEARFRVTGKAPELWHADTGRIEPVSYRIEQGETVVPLALAGEESVFVVFRRPAITASLDLPAAKLAPIAELSGPWTVRFQPGRGAPAEVTLPALGSLSEQADPGVKYFSGEATYRRSFALPRGVRPGAPLWLDLGAVGDLAEVSLNGVVLGQLWHAPWRIDVGPAAKAGTNRLEVKVANRWVNRLIGDMQPGAKKVTWTAVPTYKPDAPLRPSGLIGPVRLEAERR